MASMAMEKMAKEKKTKGHHKRQGTILATPEQLWPAAVADNPPVNIQKTMDYGKSHFLLGKSTINGNFQ